MIYEYDKIVNDVGPKIQKVLDKHMNNGQPPLFMFGVVMIIIAAQFKRFNYKEEDFYSFLDYTKTIWEDEEKPNKPHLTLIVNNEITTSNTSPDS